jgi:DNA-binding transcriptional regulator LsrR (DeoR family)
MSVKLKNDMRIVGPTPPRRRGKKHRGISKDQNLARQAALAKFPPTGDPPYRSNREVAQILGINLQGIPDLIKTAFQQGYVSAVHHLAFPELEQARLQDAVRLRYGLQRVMLVPGLPEMLEELDVLQRRNVQTQVIQAMAPRVVAYLDALLTDAAARRETFTLGVAWGRTMRLIAECLRSTPRPVRFPELEVVPIVGITSESTREPTEANVIAMHVAEPYKGQSSQLACPAFVAQEDKWIVAQCLQQVRRMLKKLTTCDVVITSMGQIPDNDKAAREISLSSDPVLSQELCKAARTRGAIGEICFWLFDERGDEVRTTHAAIGLGFAGLQSIASDPSRQVILVAGGDRRRFKPLRAALRAHLASVLVSDTLTARYLMEEQ